MERSRPNQLTLMKQCLRQRCSCWFWETISQQDSYRGEQFLSLNNEYMGSPRCTAARMIGRRHNFDSCGGPGFIPFAFAFGHSRHDTAMAEFL